MSDTLMKPSKTAAHARKHASKYALAGAMAAIVTALQLLGTLAPLLCSMPFIHDMASCLTLGAKAKEAAHSLDGMKLDDGATLDAHPVPAPTTVP